MPPTRVYKRGSKQSSRHCSPLLQTPKLSPSPSGGPLGPQCYDALDLEAAEATYIAEGERLRQARISRAPARKAANDKALAEQLSSQRAHQEHLESELLELEFAEAAATAQYARHHALASAKRLALSRQYDDLHKLAPTALHSDQTTPSLAINSSPLVLSQALFTPHLLNLATS